MRIRETRVILNRSNQKSEPVYNVSIALLSEEKLLEKILESIEPFIVSPKRNSFCVACGNLATNLAKFRTEGAIILEKYCDRCTQNIESNQVK